MLAELYYPAGTNISYILTDMASVLSGVTDKNNLSVGLDKTQSVIVADKKPSNWELMATMNYGQTAAMADILPNTTSVAIGGARIMRQACSTSPGKYKYMKFGFLTHNSTFATLAVNVGNGYSGNLLTGYHNTYYYSGAAHFYRNGTTAITLNPLRFTVYGSATAVMVNIAETDLLTPTFIFSLMEFEKHWYNFDAADGMTVVLSLGSGSTGNDTASRGSSTYEMSVTVPITINGTQWGSAALGAHTSRSARVLFCTPERRLTRSMYALGSNKFAGFKPTGTQYDMISFGVNMFDARQYGASGDPNFPPTLQEMFPYSSITTVTGIYMTHKDAFGKSGAHYQTPVGVMCKFGQYMVEVG